VIDVGCARKSDLPSDDNVYMHKVVGSVRRHLVNRGHDPLT
jgi:hypothetical protein